MSTFGAQRPRRIAIVILLAACTLGARAPGALHDPLWQDEVGTMHVISQRSPRSALGQVVRQESTPPVFFLTEWAVDHGAAALDSGVKPGPWLRAIPLAFSIVTTVLTFLLACELLPLWAATLAGLLVAFSGELVVHGAELRAYALLALTYVAFAFVLERAVAHPRRLTLVLLGGVVAVGSLTHYFFVFALAAAVVWLLTSVRERPILLRVGAAIALGLVPLLLWSPYWHRQYNYAHWGAHFGWARLISFLPVLFAPDVIVHETGRIVQVAVSAAVIGSAALLLRRPEGRLCALLVLVPVLGTWTAWAVGQSGVGNPRNLIGVVPFAAIALASACASLPSRRLSFAAAGLVGALVLAGFVAGQRTLARTPYDRIADEVVAQGFRPEEPLVWFGSYGGIIPVAWYLTPDATPETWPRVVAGTPSGGRCDAVEVVARTGPGRPWLYDHRADVLEQTSVPFHSDAPRGKRGHNVLLVARLRWKHGLLESAAAAGAFLLHRADTSSDCLSP